MNSFPFPPFQSSSSHYKNQAKRSRKSCERRRKKPLKYCLRIKSEKKKKKLENLGHSSFFAFIKI